MLDKSKMKYQNDTIYEIMNENRLIYLSKIYTLTFKLQLQVTLKIGSMSIYHFAINVSLVTNRAQVNAMTR